MVAAKKIHEDLTRDHSLDAAGYSTSWLDFVALSAAKNGGLIVEGSIEARMIRESSIRIQEVGKPDRYVPLVLDPSLEGVHQKILPQPTFCFYCLRERGERDSNCRGCGGAHFLTRAALAQRSRS